MAAHSAAIISMPILLAAARVDHLLDQDRPDFTGHRNNAIQYLFTQLRMITGAEHGTDHLGLRCASKIAGARAAISWINKPSLVSFIAISVSSTSSLTMCMVSAIPRRQLDAASSFQVTRPA